MYGCSPPQQSNENSNSPLAKLVSLRALGQLSSTSIIEPFTIPRPQGLPHELDEYLTTTDKPHEIFTCLQDSRDRRLRLLLRRFTNQIQYGCKNPQCGVSTCLSYRKRYAITPLRPYNDIAARALAWRCVEQYADAGKGQGRVDKNRLNRKNKANRSLHDNASGLCWNEPVVPWYEDPAISSRRNGTSAYGDRMKQGANDYEQSPHTESNSAESSNRARGGQPHEPSETAALLNLFQPSTPSIGPGHAPSTEDAQAGHDSSDGASPGLKVQSDAGSSKQRHVAFVGLSNDPSHRPVTLVKDDASFTQTLYDTISLKHLDIQRPPNPLLQKPPSVVNNTHISAEPGTISKSDDTTPGESNTCTNDVRQEARGPSAATFKSLPLSTILWLRSTMPYDVQRSPHRDLNITTNHGSYSMFARQSLHFCLSNPSVLLQSAKTWRFVHHQPYRMEEARLSRLIKELALKDKSLLHSELPQPGGIMVAFGMLIAITSIPEVFNHLFAALQHAYVLPPQLKQLRKQDNSLAKGKQVNGIGNSSPRSKSPRTTATEATRDLDNHDDQSSGYIENKHVAQLCILITLALQLILALKPQSFNLVRGTPVKDFRERYSEGRRSGVMFPYANLSKAWAKEQDNRPNYQAYTARLDTMDDWSFQRLLDSLADVFSHRTAITNTNNASKCMDTTKNHSETVVQHFIGEVLLALKNPDPIVHKPALQFTLIDLLRSVILRRWDRNAVIKKRGPVGGALILLAAIYRNRTELGIPPNEFQWTFISDAFDKVEMPMKWLEFREDNTQTHILSYSFLFEPASLVTYFRAINSVTMKKSHESAAIVYNDAHYFLHTMPLTVYGSREILDEIRPNMARFFVLTIRRDNLLQDAMNQLWRRRRQEMIRPLKVRLGKDEGEDGLDHGGVQAEFFRLVFAEALDPAYGMFTIDDRSRMTWFQPGSLEPLYKFEALGILLSLAVYNGITLPITFPLAFYRKLLGLKVKTLQHIMDGWSALGRGLQQLLDWKDGDVGQVIARTYEFSYEAFGASYTVDMTQVGRNDPWPLSTPRRRKHRSKTASFNLNQNPDRSPPSEEDDIKSTIASGASSLSSLSSSPSPSTGSLGSDSDSEAPLVTNANREQYVKDYIYWLTNKSITPQFTAFATGFYTCLDRTALSIFTPEHLKTVVEGHQHIDIDGLYATATYDDYKSTDEAVQWFWQVVRDMSPEQHKHLLEFVTASDRVPVNGIDSIVFIIQRNGESDERLPSSSTCYGRLLLPKYSTKDILKAKLEKAIENSVGFGSL